MFYLCNHRVSKKHILVIACSLLFCYSALSQTTPFAKGFDKGFKEGYCYNHQTVDCLTPLTPLVPLPRLNESQDSYTDGYNRGFQSGLDLQRLQSGLGTANGVPYQNIPNYRFNDYTPQVPIEAMVNVAIYKQKLLDARINWIQQRIYDMQDLAYALVYQFSSTDYDNLIKQQSDFLDKNVKGKSIDWSDNYMFNQIVNYFKTEERNIYITYNNLIYEANSTIVDNMIQCNNYQLPIYVIKKNSDAFFSSTPDLKDTLFTADYEFNGLINNPAKKKGIIVFYSRSKHAYYKMDAQEYYFQADNTTTQMNYVTSCDAIFIRDVLENSILILDKGITPDFKGIGIKAYKTPRGDYFPFSVYKDFSTNKRYFVPKNIADNAIHNDIYPIDAK